MSRSRAARIQAKATGQNYQRYLEGQPDAPATAAQRDLEGLFLRRLGTLRYVAVAGGASSRHGITRIEPLHGESLRIRLEAGTDVPDLAEQLLPTVLGNGEVVGIPGLRARTAPSGTSLYRPGLPGEIVLFDIRPRELERPPAAGARRAEVEKPDEWTAEEEAFARQHPERSTGLDIESAILRRAVLFNDSGAYTIRVMEPSGQAARLEFLFDDLTPGGAGSLRDNLVSRHLSPPLVLRSYAAPGARPGSIAIELPDTGEGAELRLTIRPRRSARR